MCGIFALFSKTPLSDELIQLGRAGMAALQHRGPDARGEFIDRERGVFIGHQRLKIIDLSENAAQPMRRDAHVLAYNGEFYGFRDLQRALQQQGEVFRSQSDTEVVLAAWRRWGPATVDRLDGMFAFVLWDGEDAWLITDHFGEKMLYVASTSWGVAVASELEALRAMLKPQMRLDDAVIDEFLALGYVSAPRTFYRDVLKLAPASRLRVRGGRIAGSEQYWTPPLPEPGRGLIAPIPEAGLDRIQAALSESTRRRLVADVPLCLFLSSGVDSSVVASMVAKDIKASVQCLTINAPLSAATDESSHAASVAANLGLPHRVVSQEPFLGEIGVADLLRWFGQPNDNVGIVSVVAVAAAARAQGFTVGLTGFGGDEVFRGYQKQSFAWRHRRLYALPAWLRIALGRLLSAGVGGASRTRAFRALFAVPDSQLYVALKNNPAIALLQQLPGFEGWAAERFPGTGPLYDAVARIEMTDVLPGSQLPGADIGAMSYSVELRTPFLDRRLVETVAAFDPRALLAFGQKSVLRSLLARYLPSELIQTGKKGFVYPMAAVLANQHQPATIPGIADPSWISSIWQQRERGDMQRLALRMALLETFVASHGGG